LSDTPPVDAPAFTPPKDQADFDRMIGERLARERQKFADYDDLRAKAERLNELEAANRSELEKAQAAIAERDAKLADLPKQVRGQILRFASTASAKGFIDPGGYGARRPRGTQTAPGARAEENSSPPTETGRRHRW
jgi:hypothetical protein